MDILKISRHHAIQSGKKMRNGWSPSQILWRDWAAEEHNLNWYGEKNGERWIQIMQSRGGGGRTQRSGPQQLHMSNFSVRNLELHR